MNSSLPIWLIWQLLACFAFWIWGVCCVYEKGERSCIKRVDDGRRGTSLYAILPFISGVISFILYLCKHKSNPELWYTVLYPIFVFLGCSFASFLALVFGIACGIAETEKHIRRKKR